MPKISVRYKIIRFIIKTSGIKKILALPSKELLQKAQKMNCRRCFKVPKDGRYSYEDIVFLDRYHCLKIGSKADKSKKAVLFLYGGGMILGPDSGDIKFASNIGKQSKSDIWFPFYPLCIENSIDYLYKVVYEVYKKMVQEYGAENISFLGFSSGAALCIGLCQYNHKQSEPLPMPELIIACSPGSVPQSPEEKAKMQGLSNKDIMVDAAFMSRMQNIMSHGKDVPAYMLSGVCGDFTDMPEIHFYYGTDEILYAEADYFKKACEKYNVKYHIHIGNGMCHCYPMIPFCPESKNSRQEIIELLKYHVKGVL